MWPAIVVFQNNRHLYKYFRYICLATIHKRGNRIWLFHYQLLKAELDKNNLLDLLRLDSLTSHV